MICCATNTVSNPPRLGEIRYNSVKIKNKNISRKTNRHYVMSDFFSSLRNTVMNIFDFLIFFIYSYSLWNILPLNKEVFIFLCRWILTLDYYVSLLSLTADDLRITEWISGNGYPTQEFHFESFIFNFHKVSASTISFNN